MSQPDISSMQADTSKNPDKFRKFYKRQQRLASQLEGANGHTEHVYALMRNNYQRLLQLAGQRPTKERQDLPHAHSPTCHNVPNNHKPQTYDILYCTEEDGTYQWVSARKEHIQNSRLRGGLDNVAPFMDPSVLDTLTHMLIAKDCTDYANRILAAFGMPAEIDKCMETAEELMITLGYEESEPIRRYIPSKMPTRYEHSFLRQSAYDPEVERGLSLYGE